MNKIAKIALTGALVGSALWFGGCSQQQIDTANRNFLATICANGQTLLTQIPTGILTVAQIQNIQMVACSTAFGSTPAPTPAPGNGPVFPGPAPAIHHG